MAELDEEDENGEQEVERPEIKSVKDLQKYAEQKYDIADVVKELGSQITPEDFIEKFDMIEAEVRKFNHWGEEYWRRAHEARDAKLAEIAKFDKYNVNLFAVFKELDQQEHQAWVDYSAILEVASKLMWRRNAVFFNSYAAEHNVKRGVEEAEVKMVEKATATIIAYAEQRGIGREVIESIVQKHQDKIGLERRIALEHEDARVNDIEVANLIYIRAHKDEKGEVKWNDLREGVGSHFTRNEWESVTKKQRNVRIRRERHGSRMRKFVSEIPGAAGNGSDVSSGERY